MAKVARCGSVLCWRIACAVVIVVGIIFLIAAIAVGTEGSPSTFDCISNDNYICDSGCADSNLGVSSSVCDIYADTDSDCPSGKGTQNLRKACECVTDKSKCDRTRGMIASFVIGPILLCIGLVFVCGAVPCCCFADDAREDIGSAYQTGTAAGHPAPVVAQPTQMAVPTMQAPGGEAQIDKPVSPPPAPVVQA